MSTFEFIHTKKRNRLEHQHLNYLVYVQYNQKIISRFQKRRELKRNFDPLVFEDSDWGNEWVVKEPQVVNPSDELTWADVDLALGAAAAAANCSNLRRIQSTCQASSNVYTRWGGLSSTPPVLDGDSDVEVREEDSPNDDEGVDDDYGERVPTQTRRTETAARGALIS